MNVGIRGFLVVLVFAGLPRVDSAAAAAELDDGVRSFLKTYCARCHSGGEPQADFRITSLATVVRAEDAENWKLVLANLSLGEMPPEEARQPSAKEVQAVTSWIEAELRRARRVLAGQTGEVVLRRLNRTEYESTIADLFDVRGDFADGFPADATAEGFDNNGGALTLSAEQIAQYMQAAEFVINRAIQMGERPQTRKAAFTLHDSNAEAWRRRREQLERRQRDFARLTPNEQQRTKEMLAELKRNPHSGFSFPVWENGKLRTPTPADGPGVDGVIAIKAGYAAPTTRHVFHPRHAGWYRFSIQAYAVSNGGEPVRLKISYGSLAQGTVPTVADVIHLTDSTPQKFEYRLYFQPHDIVKIEMLDGQNWAPRDKLTGLPGPFVAIREMEMEGPLFDQWPPKGHRVLLGTRETGSLTDDEMPRILSELAPRLFRRPVTEAVVGEYVEFYSAARNSNLPPLDAFRLTVQAMMVSPHFLYHVEFGDVPDAYALANRLSYFLWRSAPDAELRELAESGHLTRPDVLRSQVDRLLADARSERFLNDFVGQWLGIDRVGEMQPDANLYPEYDAELERAMVEETRSFIREILQHDLSLENLIDSDWAMLNERMARHYGIAGVSGNEFRRVPLDRDTTVRGGLLTQASILNITSNGTTTSPVVRGVWILERLLGTPAPTPPPDVPAVEPDIRGASTIQEQLARHRSIAQCASCHRRIDPYGFALENFDAIGGWRENYRALQPTANPNRPKLVDGPQVISADELTGYGGFRDFREFRTLLGRQQERVSANMARQLATFALGRSMEFADEQGLQNIVSATDSRGGGMKTMIRELVAGELFRRP